MKSVSIGKWGDLLSSQERKVIDSYSPNFSNKAKIGARPLFLIVDCTYRFAGLDAPIEESIKKWPLSSGAPAWTAIRKIAKLLYLARKNGVNVGYTFPSPLGGEDAERSGVRQGFRAKLSKNEVSQSDRIVDELRPLGSELVINKVAPSAFFLTPLLAWLVAKKVDSIFVVGGTTSGCMRSTVVDGSGYRYPMIVVEDCVFDRIGISHRVALLDIQMKYGNLMSYEDALNYFKRL